MLNAAQANQETALKLRKLYIDQTVQLSPPLTQALQLIEPIYSPSQPVFPKRMLTIAIALVAGLFTGILGLFVHRGWQNYTREQVR